jgi:DNA-binding IclR family transcriptional regulator
LPSAASRGSTISAGNDERVGLLGFEDEGGSPEERDRPRKGINSVETAFRLLAALETAASALPLKELAREAGLTPSAAHHYLVSLIRIGAVEQREDGRYDLGRFALQLGITALLRMDGLEFARQVMQSFRDEVDEAIFFAVWGNLGPTIVRWVESSHPVTVEVRVGNVMPVLRSATGNVFLAWLPPAVTAPFVERERVMRERYPGDAGAFGDPGAVERIRDEVRRSGLAATEGGLTATIGALAAPVFEVEGRLAGALTTLGWLGQIDLRSTGPTARALQRAADDLSRRLGHRSPPAP